MALKGNAAFKYTPVGSTSEKTYNLNFPLELVPGGGLRAAHRKHRAIADSLTFGNREVIRTSSGVYELEARLRFGENPQGLLDMLKEGADGAELKYFPDPDSTGTNFPSQLIGVENMVEIEEDRDRYHKSEYEVTIRLRRTDGGNFSTLLSDT